MVKVGPPHSSELSMNADSDALQQHAHRQLQGGSDRDQRLAWSLSQYGGHGPVHAAYKVCRFMQVMRYQS